MIRDLVNRALGRFGYEVRRPASPIDTTPEIAAIWRDVRPFTMTSFERVVAICDSVRYIDANGVQGAFVECGVWRGGSAMAMALSLGVSAKRELYLFDTYEGMPPPTAHDVDLRGEKPQPTDAWLRVTESEVRANLARTNYPNALVHTVVGRVEDTIPERAPAQIALLRLDTDWFESTKHELEHLFPRLARGGVLIIDDYGHWRGARRAVDEYFARRKIAPFLHRVDYTGRIMLNVY